MKNKIFLFSVIVLVVIIGSIFYFKKHGQKTVSQNSPTPTPVSTVTPAAPTVSPSSTAVGKPSLVSCTLSGAIKFIKSDLSQNLDAKIQYTGVDSPVYQIKWTISPQDNLLVGPNLVAQLPIPNGSSMVIVTLPEHPLVKSYTLKSAITHGSLTLAKCSGEVKVSLDY